MRGVKNHKHSVSFDTPYYYPRDPWLDKHHCPNCRYHESEYSTTVFHQDYHYRMSQRHRANRNSNMMCACGFLIDHSSPNTMYHCCCECPSNQTRECGVRSGLHDNNALVKWNKMLAFVKPLQDRNISGHLQPSAPPVPEDPSFKAHINETGHLEGQSLKKLRHTLESPNDADQNNVFDCDLIKDTNDYIKSN